MSLMNLRYRNEAAVPPLPPWGAAAGQQPQQQQFTSLAAFGSSSSSGNSRSSSSPTTAAAAAAAACSAAAGGGHSGVEGPGLSAWQRGGYCAGAVLLRYGWARLTHHAAVQRWGDAGGAFGGGGGGSSGAWRARAWAALRRLETAYRLASLLNLLVFLGGGRYRWGRGGGE